MINPQNKQPHIFVSHGKKDMWVASSIAQHIKQCGASTFLDESNIAKGDDFKKLIHKEIAICDELVALFTPWSVARTWVWVEIGAAWGQGKRIVAVLYGITVQELEKAGGRGILEDINLVELNQFDDYLAELKSRSKEDKND